MIYVTIQLCRDHCIRFVNEMFVWVGGKGNRKYIILIFIIIQFSIDTRIYRYLQFIHTHRR